MTSMNEDSSALSKVLFESAVETLYRVAPGAWKLNEPWAGSKRPVSSISSMTVSSNSIPILYDGFTLFTYALYPVL